MLDLVREKLRGPSNLRTTYLAAAPLQSARTRWARAPSGRLLQCDADLFHAAPWARATCVTKAIVLYSANPPGKAVPKALADLARGMQRREIHVSGRSLSDCGMALLNTAWTYAGGITDGHRRVPPKGVASLALSPRFL